MTNVKIIGRQREEGGFTLIELIVVIVVLGILVATAVPKYLSVTKDARIAALSGLAAGLNGSMAIVDAKAKLQGTASGSNVTDGTTSIAVTSGATPSMLFPNGSATGIGNAINISGSTINGGSGAGPIGFATPTYTGSGSSGVAKFLLQPSGASSGIANCEVDYTGPTASTTDATVSIITSGC